MLDKREQHKKVGVRLSHEAHANLEKMVPWGMRRLLIEAILELVLEAIEHDGPIMIGAIIGGQYKLVRDDSEPRQNLARIANVEA